MHGRVRAISHAVKQHPFLAHLPFILSPGPRPGLFFQASAVTVTGMCLAPSKREPGERQCRSRGECTRRFWLEISMVSSDESHVERKSPIAFWAALVLAFAIAVGPSGPAEKVVWDKAQHALAFCVLTILGSHAYRKASFPLMALLLTGFGIVIECVQAIPKIHRDSSLLDVVADVAGIVLGAAIIAIFRNRLALSNKVKDAVERPDFWIFALLVFGPVAYFLIGKWIYYQID